MALRSRLISSTIAALASASRQRTGSSSTPAKSSGPRSSRSGALTEAIWVTWRERPDLLATARLTQDERKLVERFERGETPDEIDPA